MKKIYLVTIPLTALLLSGCGGSAVPQDEMIDVAPPVQTQQTQQTSPVATAPSSGWTLYLTSKKLFPGNPETTVHKYCKTVVGNMTQCQLFDGNDSDSRLVGVETMVGPEMFNTFSQEEKKMWSPTRDFMQSTMTAMPDLDAQQYKNVSESLAANYSKVYLMWDPGKINLPTGSPMVTITNSPISTGGVVNVTTPSPAAPPATPDKPNSTPPGPAPATIATNGSGYTFAAFDVLKLAAAALDQKKGNFETSVLQKNNVGSLELVKLKDRIGLHQYTNTTHLIFIVSGKGEFTVGDKKQPVSAGMVVIIPAGTPHAFQNLNRKDTPLIFTTFKNPYDEKDVKWLE